MSTIQALQAIGASSPICRDVALFLLLVAHGPDPHRLAGASPPPPPPAADDDASEPPPPRAPLRRPAEAALFAIRAAAPHITTAALTPPPPASPDPYPAACAGLGGRSGISAS